MQDIAEWRETYDGGSPEAEEQIFAHLAEQMIAIQESNRIEAGSARPYRTLHAKQLVGIANASLAIDEEMPAALSVEHFKAGSSLPVIVRFSSASALPQSDALPDMRGAALKLCLPGGEKHDLLMTSFPVSHARDARQFVRFAMIASGDRSALVERVIGAFGDAEAKRILSNIQSGARPCASLALERYWSRGAILWRDRPVRFDLRPTIRLASDQAAGDLHAELAERLKNGNIRFRLAIQRYIDDNKTPIEDGAIEWREIDSDPIEIATLTIPCQDLLSEDARVRAAEVNAMAFNPWNAPPAFRPLGNLNRARRIVYQSSAKRWQNIAD